VNRRVSQFKYQVSSIKFQDVSRPAAHILCMFNSVPVTWAN
jgi:hypothetical protein